MRIAFAAIPAHGHLYPLMPLALACRDGGHQVVVAVGSPFAERLPLPTIDPFGRPISLSEVERQAVERHPEAAGMELALAIFADITAGLTLPGLLQALTEFRPDLVIYDSSNTGAGVAADLLGVPALAFGVGRWDPFGEQVHAATLRFRAGDWTDRGRRAPQGQLLGAALLDPLPPPWRGDDVPFRMPIRTVAWSEQTTAPPQWLRTPGTRPRVYVTLGTVAFGATDALRRAVIQTAEQGAEVLVAIGERGDRSALGTLPDTVHVEQFVAQDSVLPLVDLAVHHGGTGTVLGALAAGLPQVLMPQGTDQFANAHAIAAAGLATVIGNDEPDSAMGDAVEALLGECPERSAAGAQAALINDMPSPQEFVGRLDEFAA
ncbi:glycosyltransferase [Nakamurella lactea]|uniref:glycosyltransferase n=1 Tax=Nakamurella lactea TaxID=459515 RepID=UPI00040A9D07|nr:glycosyltransferase [Nakamurella lactea]